MNNHTRAIIEQIAKYAIKIPDRKKDELFELLSNPDNTLSWEFFELYNNKEVSKLVWDENELTIYDNKLKEFFENITQYNTDSAQEMASWDYKCVFANSADLVEWLEDNCEERQYWYDRHLPLTLQSCEWVTPLLFEPNIEEINTLLYDWNTYKALKHFFLEYSKIFTRWAFDNASLITLLKSDMLDNKIQETYKKLLDYVEYKARTPKDQHTYLNAVNDDQAKSIVDKDIEAIQEIIEYGQYDIFDTKMSDIDPAVASLLSTTNSKYISLLKKIIWLHNQAEENDMYLQNIFPLSNKLFKGAPVTQILLRYYKNNYWEQRANITNLLLDIQQQEMLLWSRLQWYTAL